MVSIPSRRGPSADDRWHGMRVAHDKFDSAHTAAFQGVPAGGQYLYHVRLPSATYSLAH